MLTVIIVDDEFWVCQLIKKIINWEKLNFTVIGEAYNGDEAYELIKEKRPDLAIIDIRMPGMDGIDLIKNIKEMEIETGFIIVSGYNDFSYTQNALKYGALGYLLKPIDQKELEDLLEVVGTKVYAQKQKLIEDKLVRGKLELSLMKLQEQFFQSVICNVDLPEQNIDLSKINNEYDTYFMPGYFKILIYRIDNKSNRNINKSVEKDVLEDMQQRINCIFNQECFEIIAIISNKQVICILNYDFHKDSEINNMVFKSFNIIKSFVPMIRKFELTLGVGSTEKEFGSLPESYRFAENALKARVILGVNQVIDISKNVYFQLDFREIFPIYKEKRLECFLEVFDNEALEILIAAMFSDFKERKDVNPISFFQLCYEIIEVFFKVMRRIGLDMEGENISKSKIYNEINECQSIQHVLTYFSNLFNYSKKIYNSSKNSKKRKVIEITKAYIIEHFKEEIRLEDVANQVFMNPKYLGELFKKETGINFSDYIIHYRMEMAKELLKDVRLKIYEVAEKVGYTDAKHFSKLFKKTVGVKPTDYKKIFM
ncbi:response regulator [Petroclostridium sp. X23]|uniref:response regulator n=1 Tax=Petroclostridium sp. X23 TaxID=3045146 RepID=UPI0024AD2585|nr:response regulator [Petroclostridium sp. X23]WHH60507.1 response regulator [Petroclostridium sp. X23]